MSMLMDSERALVGKAQDERRLTQGGAAGLTPRDRSGFCTGCWIRKLPLHFYSMYTCLLCSTRLRLRLGSGRAQVSSPTAQVEQQLLRSKDGNGNCSFRDPASNSLFHLTRK